ncbi:hypothetical protein [Domibacillus indicus]|uniref:hypothetical protein n=1 Tax=Domibacillus indicus TaxID=1437523 RepID=UPI0012E0BFBB|nr:hypothetical protein [Domibacillus indicus]
MRVFRYSLLSVIVLIGSSLIAAGFAVMSKMEEKQKVSVEMTAFNSLPQEEASRIAASPKDSTVKQVQYQEQDAYEVTFHHTETESLGELVVYIGMDRETVLGQKNTK